MMMHYPNPDDFFLTFEMPGRRHSTQDMLGDLATKLNNVRIKKRLSVADVTKRAGIKSRSTTNAILHGHINKTIQLNSLLKIAQALGINLQFVKPA